MEEQKLEDGTVLRVGVTGGGCSGFSYSLGFDNNVDEVVQRARDAKRDEILARIAALASEHEAGDVGPEYYARTRAQLRDELALLAKQAGHKPS